MGEKVLSIPPRTPRYESIFYYDIENFVEDGPPWYNPVYYKEYIDITSQPIDATVLIDLDWDVIKKDFFIYIQSMKHRGNKLDDIELCFNDLSNRPSLFLSNSVFIFNNNHRIKRLWFIVKQGVSCELLVMVADKFMVAQQGIGYSNNVISYEV